MFSLVQNVVAALVLGGSAGFAGVKMVLAGLSSHDFAGSCDPESFSHSLVSFLLGHSVLGGREYRQQAVVNMMSDCLLLPSAFCLLILWSENY